ncbi:MAG: zf-HC2 domain-containing protein, partial [Acidobacteriota bacterium]
MDHTYIEERGLIDLYHRGQIPPSEEAEFEEHFVGCRQCQDLLEAARGFQRGLKTVVAEDAARTVVQAGLLAWALRRRGLVVALLALIA